MKTSMHNIDQSSLSETLSNSVLDDNSGVFMPSSNSKPHSIAVNIKNGFMRFFQTPREENMDDINKFLDFKNDKSRHWFKLALTEIEKEVRDERLLAAKLALEKGTLVAEELNILANYKDSEQLIKEAFSNKSKHSILPSAIVATSLDKSVTGKQSVEDLILLENARKETREKNRSNTSSRKTVFQSGRDKLCGSKSEFSTGSRNKGDDAGGSNVGTTDNKIKVSPTEARNFIFRCLQAKGEREGNALIIADNLISSDEKGIQRYGLQILG